MFFSDLHLGAHSAPGTLARLVQRINAQKPDLVLFGGDLLDNANRDYKKLDLPGIAAALARIEAPCGKFCVCGNHDYKKGGVHFYAPLMERAGFTVLRNCGAWIAPLRLSLYGFDDFLETRLSPALFRQNEILPGLVLCHEPDPACILSVRQRCIMLAGHTHGGQVRLPYFARRMAPPAGHLYPRGLTRGTGARANLDLLVSTGVGMTGLPLRLGNPPQIVVLDLM